MRQSSLLGAVVVAAAVGSGLALAAIPAGERQALVDLYNGTNGASWTNKTNWLGAAGTECTWHGVTCDAGQSTVTKLELGGNGLSGSIPTQLGGLTNLTTLDLDSNGLTGAIPSQLGNLTNLQLLYLNNNQLSGSIPTSLGSLASLGTLSLSTNQLSGSIPDSLGNLTNLLWMELYANQLSGSIPAALGSLTNLVGLYLYSNQLSGSIPTQLGNLTKLQYVYLSTNQLSGSIPAQLGNLSKLMHLYLDSNQLSGSIPPELGNLTNLYQLALDTNQLSGPIPDLSGVVHLTLLTLDHNRLSGPIPTWVGNNANLMYLVLGGNHLSGPIPTWLGNLTKLGGLSLESNQLSGSIPTELGNLTQLEYLWLNGNQLSGPIPTSLENLTNVDRLQLGYNALFSTDAGLTAFLSSREGDWQSTQTVAPTGVAVGVTTNSSVALSWTPITYTGDAGGYQASYATTSGGPYTADGITAGKSTTSIVVDSLNPGATYYFVIRTVTNPNANNQNTVASDPSTEVHATTAGTPATLAITTTSPLPAGTVGVSYSLQFAASGGVGGNSWSVVSGSLDGLSLSSGGLLSGTPTASGDFSFTVKVTDAAAHTAQGTFSLHVNAGISYPYAVWVPVASHNGGKHNSQWRSDLGLLNTNAATANVQLKFFGSGGMVSNTTYVPAKTQSVLADVVGQIGGVNSGAIEVLSDQPLKVTARSYNLVASDASCYAAGTQGQDYPVLVATGGLSTQQSAYLPGLTEVTSGYHCNIGVVNIGSVPATVLVELFDGAGTKLTDYPVSLNPGDWKQETQPFLNKAGQTAMERGYAKVTVQTGSGVFAFASVVDGVTNDPTTIAMQR